MQVQQCSIPAAEVLYHGHTSFQTIDGSFCCLKLVLLPGSLHPLGPPLHQLGHVISMNPRSF